MIEGALLKAEQVSVSRSVRQQKHFQGAYRNIGWNKLICTSKNNLQHQCATTHSSRDGWRERSIWHVGVRIHIWHHDVPGITWVGGSLVIEAPIWMLSWGRDHRIISDAFLSVSLHFSSENQNLEDLFTEYSNWIIMLYFRSTVFILLSGLAVNQMFEKTCGSIYFHYWLVFLRK